MNNKDIKDIVIDKSSNMVSNAIKKPRGITKQNARLMAEKAKKSPKHGKHGRLKKTILIEEAYKNIQEKIIERSMGLINTQTIIAHGTIKIFKIVTTYVGSGKNKKRIREKPVLVTSDEEIAEVIDYEYGDGESPNDDETYYFVSVQDPDNRAIKDQLDRIGLKAPDKLDINAKGQLTLSELYKKSQDNE